MLFRFVLNSLWEGITSKIFFKPVTTTTTPPPMDRDMDLGAVSGEFSSVDYPCVSNLSVAASMPGAYYPDLPVRPTSPAGCPGYGFCASPISTSPSPVVKCEGEVGFGGGGRFSGYSTAPSPPHDGPTEHVVTSHRSPASSPPGYSGLTDFAPSTNADYSGSGFSGRAPPSESAIPCRYPTPPWSGYSGYGCFAPSTNSEYSSSSPPSTSPSPYPSKSFTDPAASATFSNTQEDINIRSSSKEESKFDTLGVNSAEAPPGTPGHSEFIRDRALEKRILNLRRRLLFLKNRELRQGLSDKLLRSIALTEHLLNSELGSGKSTAENESVSYASKRALELEAGDEVGAPKGAKRIELCDILVPKKARFTAKRSCSKTKAKFTTSTGGNTKTPPTMTSGTYSARTASQAQSPAPPPPPPPLDHITRITPTNPENPNSGVPRSLPRTPPYRKRVQGDEAATTHKKLKTERITPHKKTSKRGPSEALKSGKKTRGPAKAPHSSRKNRPPPVKSSRARSARGAPVTLHAEVTWSRKRTSENAVVKNAVTKRPRKEYFSEGMILEYESDSDTETADEEPDKAGAQSASHSARHTFTASTTTPTKSASSKYQLAPILGKRASTATQGFGGGDTGNKKGRKEYFQEGMILEYESDDESVSSDHNNHGNRSAGGAGYYHHFHYLPQGSTRMQSAFAASVEDPMDEGEIL